MHKLLKTKGITYEKKIEKEAKTRQEIFQRAYFKEKARILSEVERESAQKKRLRERLGLVKKQNFSFYQMEKKNLSYFETKYRGIEGHGIYKQRLHPVCWLYEQCAQRASTNPTDLDDPFDNKKK